MIQKAAVLGAGVMGAQIAGHLANAGIAVELFDLPSQEGSRNQTVDEAISRLGKLEPAPLASASVLSLIRACNYDDHLDRLADCQLVIEAVAERMDIKRSLYAKVAPQIAGNAWVASNTSGLSIESLSKEIPESLRSRFCGMHFFNPPRYMSLVELIPTKATDPSVIDSLETWLTRTVGKSVVRAKDTPNFIANRIGVFSLLATMRHTEAFGLGLDTVDALTGPKIGRPKSASYRTVDVVGIDTLALDCVRSCELLDELRTGFEDGTLKPFSVAAADMIDLSHAMEAYKAVLAGAKNRMVLKP
jgi:3-hydroxyacyl-CoA dehydrogenase